jgi:phosphoserine aminotransferase
MGGLDYYIMLANQRSLILYNFIDSSNEFYSTKIKDTAYRSRINVIFRIQGGDEGLEETFISQAKEAGII